MTHRVSDLFTSLRGRPGHEDVTTAAGREAFLSSAIDAGKITEASSEGWRSKLNADPQATASEIERLAPVAARQSSQMDVVRGQFGLGRRAA